MPPPTPQSPCPSENAFAQLLDGSLPAEARALLEAHVEGCSACDGALSELGRLLASAAPGPTPRGGEPPRGSARYTIASAMGAGGFGRVYDAYDVILRRRVALKFLHSEGGVANVAQRMLDEARALASLSHPNVVQIYDVDVDGPSVFMAMELVEGETLARWLRTPHPLDERLAIVRSVAEALVAAHGASILHRDVKPDNVLVGRDGRVRLGDFGLACHAEAPPERVGGTPFYLAPEVRAGAPASALADQYAFALLARECVFGVPPNQQSSTVPAGSEAPDALWFVLQRAASATPQQRYPSMEALHRALQSALHWDRSPHATGAMAVQAVMSFVYAAVSAFSVWALLSDDAPEAGLGDGHWAMASSNASVAGPLANVDGVTLLYNAVGALLVVLLVSGWMPIAAIWGVMNTWALARKRSWARTSTLAYAVLSLLTLIGTPAGAYLLYAMLRTRRIG